MTNPPAGPYPHQPEQQWGAQPPQGYGPPQAYAPPRRRRRKWPWVLLAFCVLLFGGCAAVVASISEEAKKVETVKYEVTGDAKDVTITYSTYQSGNASTSQETVPTLPWSKSIDVKGLGKGGSLSVITGSAGGSVTCSVTVGDDPPRTATGSGPFAMAVCSGF